MQRRILSIFSYPNSLENGPPQVKTIRWRVCWPFAAGRHTSILCVREGADRAFLASNAIGIIGHILGYNIGVLYRDNGK